jgi:hypothetical protein
VLFEKNTLFWKLDVFPSCDKMEEASSLLLLCSGMCKGSDNDLWWKRQTYIYCNSVHLFSISDATAATVTSPQQ